MFFSSIIIKTLNNSKTVLKILGDWIFSWKIVYCILTIAFIGAIAVGSGFFVLFVQPYDILFKLKCTFSDGGEIFEMWRKPPVDLYLRVFLFNVTNREAFLRGEEKLKVQEVGPYVYKELMTHENITFNDNGTVSAIPKHPLVWVPELSEGRREDDILVLPNIALLSIAHVVSDESYFTRLGLNLLIRQTNSLPLIEMTAREFMFGYKSALMTVGNTFMSSWIYFDKLGLIDRMYDFDGDFETVFTGEDDVTKAGLIDKYRGETKIPQWDNPCGNIQNASDGTKFKGNLKPNETILFFRKSMCRTQILEKVGETTSSGLKGYVYHFKENSNDNGKYYPENKCFCSSDRCLPPGLLDVHGCYYGFPIALSYPHFYKADPVVFEKTEGSKPDPEKHTSFFVINPESGLPLDVAVRMQINMALGSISTIANTERFSNMVLPLLWTEIRMYTLPNSLASRFNLYLNVLPVVQVAAMYALFFMGAAFFLVSIVRYFRKKRRSGTPSRTPWIDEEIPSSIERKLSYIPDTRKKMNAKELEVYFNSLIAPLNQELEHHEIIETKESQG
ncbi:scavenger receptor class B member 1 isoform X2 [Agrilus planipennis]|uniref:Scavenger receptor class B member 1 isoform X2 n=1 Tax=Agrilus planipennis TaxID=224129 RepID=A0A7F5R5L1_AGRPL|nr:scavenger receptor class B member 1 isoform X2 [Agrilus planipennis]